MTIQLITLCYFCCFYFILYSAFYLLGFIGSDVSEIFIKTIILVCGGGLFVWCYFKYDEKHIANLQKRYRHNPLNKTIGARVLYFSTMAVLMCWVCICIKLVNYIADKYELNGILQWMIDWI